MPVTLAVLASAVVVAVAVALVSRTGRTVEPLDPEVEERWLVRWLGEHPRWGRRIRSVDRRVAGGAIVLAGLVVVFATALVVGLFADMVAGNTGFARWDRAVAEWGSREATGWSTDLLAALTDLGGTLTLVAIAVVVFLLDFRRYGNVQVAWFLTAVLAGSSALQITLKLIVGRDRPDVLHLVGSAGSSFPSGHATTAAAAWFAFALVLTRGRRRRAQVIGATVAALVTATVAASRALLGVHWLTDVLAGVALGWGWFLLCALAFGGRLQRLGEPAERLELVDAGGGDQRGRR